MSLPQKGDYIDIHVHGGKPAKGIFILESLMAHENKMAENISGIAYTYGIHPWFLNEKNHKQQICSVNNAIDNPNVIAIGEAGFDKLHGPSTDLQQEVFEEQVNIAERNFKPLVIHCVKAWDEMLSSHKSLKPLMPWLIHGFRGSPELARQLTSKGMYLSVWFDYVLRPESSGLLRSLPPERFFLETDGADVDIRDIYLKVSHDLGISVYELKIRIYSNYRKFFKIGKANTE